MAKTPTRGIRVPDDLWEAAQAVAAERGETVSGVVVDRLRQYVRAAGWDLDPLTVLEHLARLHALGAIPDDQFAAKRRELLDRL